MARFGTVDLIGAFPTLGRSKKVGDFLKVRLGAELAKEAVTKMRAGLLDGDLSDRVHDALVDEIHNEAKVVWDGSIKGDEFDFPVNVQAYGGVFFVWAMEYDPVGYFLSRGDAVDYIFGQWDGVSGKVCK